MLIVLTALLTTFPVATNWFAVILLIISTSFTVALLIKISSLLLVICIKLPNTLVLFLGTIIILKTSGFNC